mgnify:CR=1 FL=1
MSIRFLVIACALVYSSLALGQEWLNQICRDVGGKPETFEIPEIGTVNPRATTTQVFCRLEDSLIHRSTLVDGIFTFTTGGPLRDVLRWYLAVDWRRQRETAE